MSIELLNADCLVALQKLDKDSIDSVVTDPPSGIGLHGEEWDQYDTAKSRAPFVEFITKVFTETYRVLKPGGYGLVWALPRTSHWTAFGLEDSGFEIRDVITHHYGNGLVKTKTVLKPASEHWILVRKPPDGTLLENLAQHGVGGLQIDACRVEGATEAKGRWPTNLVFSHCPECQLQGTKQVQGQKTTTRPPDATSATGWGHKRQGGQISYPTDEQGMETVANWVCVEGCPVAMLEAQTPNIAHFFPQFGADPFMYEPKASQDERQAGTNSLFWKRVKTETGFEAVSFVEWAKLGDEERLLEKDGAKVSIKAQGNIHPTPKPVALMSWLVNLVTPARGRVLDCFLGSGTTALACALGDFGFLGIEKNSVYFMIAEARLAYTQARIETKKLMMKQQDLPLTSAAPVKADSVGSGLKLSPERMASLIRRASKKS